MCVSACMCMYVCISKEVEGELSPVRVNFFLKYPKSDVTYQHFISKMQIISNWTANCKY